MVGEFDHCFGISAEFVFGLRSDAAADGDFDLEVTGTEIVFSDTFSHTFSKDDGTVSGRVKQDDEIFLAAISDESVFLATKAADEVGDVFEHDVADVMAV